MSLKSWPLLRTVAMALLGIGVIVVVLMWLMGAFRTKVPGGPPQDVRAAAPDSATLVVKATESPVVESAVGTVEAVERIRVGSRLLARVLEVLVRASQPVQQGDVLVRLDDRDLKAAVAEAKAALDSAIAAQKQASTDLERSKELLARSVASQDRVDRDATALSRANADVQRGKEALSQADTRLGFATIRAPSAGIVIEKYVEAGNLASPGDPLVALYDPKRMQLVAVVREALATRLQPGKRVRVRIDSLDLECEAEIARIVPEAMPQSRSFKVEVTGPCPPGVMSGMFGRLLLPLGTRREILVPLRTLRRVGQIDMVFVVQPDHKLMRRFVRTGRQEGDRIEILAGLDVGETILADAVDAANAKRR